MKITYPIHKAILLVLVFPLALQAQKEMPKGSFLFETFTQGKAVLTNRKVIEAAYNYNIESQELFFLSGKEYMSMYNTSNMDTLYINDRVFVPTRQGIRFYEIIPAGEKELYVDWKVKYAYRGKKGAMGIVSQAGGQASVDISLWKHQGISNPDNSVYKTIYETTYQIIVNGQQTTFKNLKTFANLYPEEQHKAIRKLAKQEKVDFDNPWQVAAFIRKVSE